MGSGHILASAFDVLYDIYISEGYSEREIPKLILRNNLFGLDIDDRATQLAYFAIMMKARNKNKRIFREKTISNLYSIMESNDLPKGAIEYFVNPNKTELDSRVLKENVEYLINAFYDAKEYGSILKLKTIDYITIEKRLEEVSNCETEDLFEYGYKHEIIRTIPKLINLARTMSQKYDVVVTNPPYMGRSEERRVGQ